MKDNNKNYQMKKFDIVIATAIVLANCCFVNFAFGISNPAAVYCDKLGYEYIIQEAEGGQRGFCQLPDGSIVDGWKFFTGEERTEFSYCQKQGFEIKTITSEQCQYASKCAVCILEDGTEVNVAELMDFNLKSTILPWDPENQIDGEAQPTVSETSNLFYFICMMVLIIFLAIAFVVYKKIKNRDDYLE